MIRYTCTNCRTPIEIDDSLAGETDPCPVCGTMLLVPPVSQPPAYSYAAPPRRWQGPTPTSLRVLAWGLRVFGVVYALGCLGAILQIAASGSHGLPRWVGVVSLLISGGLTAMAFVGASSAGRGGDAWRPLAILVVTFHGLGALGLALTMMSGKMTDFLALPPVVGLAAVFCSEALAVTGLVLCWSRSRRPVGEGQPVGVGKPLLLGGGGGVLIQLLGAVPVLLLLLAARGMARRAVCQSNLHQLSHALRAYAAGQDGMFPPSLHLLEPYLGMGPGSTALQCPDGNAQVYFVDYVAKQAGHRNGEDLFDGRIQRGPTRLLRMPLYGEFDMPVVWESAPGHGHSGRRNVMMLDGHVETMTPEELERRLEDLRRVAKEYLPPASP